MALRSVFEAQKPRPTCMMWSGVGCALMPLLSGKTMSPQTPGMRRLEAISGRLAGSRRIWMGKNHVAPGMRSADHHHGEAETGIYVVSGHPVFVFLEDGAERRIETGPGDYVYVPPYVPHREENPSPDEEAVVVLARSTQEGIVVNLPSLRAEVPELDRLVAELVSGEGTPEP